MARDMPTAIGGVKRPLRVALFSGNYNYTVDGANRSLNRLVDHLQTAVGAQVRVYSPTAPTPAFAPVGELISVPSIAIPSRPDYRLALGITPAVRRDVLAFRPDLIHLSAPDLLGAAAQRLGRSLGAPVVASLHTLFDSYLDYYTLGWLRPWVRRRLWRFYAGCDYVLAPTEAIAAQLRVEALPARVRIWSRGVDPEVFNPERRSETWRAACGLDPGRPAIVFMGRLVMEKGLAVFAETIRRLERTGAAPQVLVIGDGPARAWFAERLPGAVFTGFLTGEALATALASGDVFFNPSSTETLGNVNLEAMASGLALVCADAPNTRSLLQHDRSAVLCPAADADAYAAAIERLLNDPATRAHMGREALAQSRRHRWSEVLEAVADVYAEALAARAGGEGAPAATQPGPAPASSLAR
jgi:phosphatidylinositol alpha 1,6-mannosyltransferase